MCRLFEGCRINADKYVIYILSCFTVQSYCCVLIIKPPAQSNKQARVCRLVCDNNCFPPVDLPSADHPTIALLPSTTTIPIIATLSLSLYTLLRENSDTQRKENPTTSISRRIVLY